MKSPTYGAALIILMGACLSAIAAIFFSLWKAFESLGYGHIGCTVGLVSVILVLLAILRVIIGESDEHTPPRTDDGK